MKSVPQLTWQGQIEEKSTIGQGSLPRLEEYSAPRGLNPTDHRVSWFLELLGTETKENLEQLDLPWRSKIIMK